MSKAFPDVFFHSISQARAREAAQKDLLPGLSRFHYDAEGKTPGIWLADNLKFVAKDQRYGGEKSDEVIDTWDAEFMRKITGRADAEAAVFKKPISPIILEIRDLEEDRLLQHPLLHEQFFYTGDLDWRKVKNFRVAENDKETVEAARELVETLKQRGIEVGIEGYKPGDVIEDVEMKKQESSLQNVVRPDNEGTI